MRFFLVFLLVTVSFWTRAQSVIERIDGADGGWVIHTKSAAYQILITSGQRVYPVFFGDAAQADYKKRTAAWTQRVEEVPVRGGAETKTSALEVIFDDNVRDTDLQYVSGEAIIVEGRPTLKLIQRDRVYPLEVVSYIRVMEEFDILEKWIEVKNTGNEGNIKIQNLLSGSILLQNNEYILTQLSGMELAEFQEFNTPLTPGLKVIQNKVFKANQNMPWFLVRTKEEFAEDSGPAWFGAVHYSGNWKIILDNLYESRFISSLQILGGINFWDTEWTLHPGETFQTPKFSVGYCNEGATGASQRQAAYVRKEILPEGNRNVLRPILYNSWYATTDKVKEDEQLEIAKRAADLGIELFALDAGWFKSSNEGWSGMGTWEVDERKFPSGLPAFIKKINELGMQFGIWVEPENIHITNEYYKANPHWVLEYPTRKSGAQKRVLNLAREDVYQHLLKSLTSLLKNNKIDFVKWDQNVYLSEPGWVDAPVEKQKEIRIRHMANLYRLVDELKNRFPKVLFESCASGGGRVDLGMMSRMDQAWTSDNTTAVDRLFIQYGYLGAMPANTMVSWVIEKISNQSQLNSSLSYKFDVAMSGVPGIGYDIRKWNDDESKLAKQKIATYKAIRPLVQQGILYRLISPFENNRTALQYNSESGEESVVFCYNMAIYVSSGYVKTAPLRGAQFNDRGSSILKLKGLVANKNYTVKKAGDANDIGKVYPGDFLMNVGIEWPVKNSFESMILLVNTVK